MGPKENKKEGFNKKVLKDGVNKLSIESYRINFKTVQIIKKFIP